MGDQIQAISSKVNQLNVYFWVGGGGWGERSVSDQWFVFDQGLSELLMF